MILSTFKITTMIKTRRATRIRVRRFSFLRRPNLTSRTVSLRTTFDRPLATLDEFCSPNPSSRGAPPRRGSTQSYPRFILRRRATTWRAHSLHDQFQGPLPLPLPFPLPGNVEVVVVVDDVVVVEGGVLAALRFKVLARVLRSL